MTLQKKIKRSLKKNLSFYITGSILTALCIMLWVGAFSVSRTITATYTELFDKTALEDGQFTVSTPLTDEDIASLESEFDVLLERQRRAYYIQLCAGAGDKNRGQYHACRQQLYSKRAVYTAGLCRNVRQHGGQLPQQH